MTNKSRSNLDLMPRRRFSCSSFVATSSGMRLKIGSALSERKLTGSATNAARHRFVAGKSKILLEFGAQRAQGPDGAISASKYCYLGGFDATSNVAAGKLFGIPLRGSHSHAFVSSFMSTDEIVDKELCSSDGKTS